MKCYRLFIAYIFVFLFLYFSLVNSHAQERDSVGMVKYTSDFRFEEGVYLNYDQVRINKPISVATLISDISPDNIEYFDKLLSKETISYVDDSGIAQKVLTRNVWGYCKNSVLYINYNNEFNRIPVVGSACHFVAEESVQHEQMSDPYSYRNYPGASTYTTHEMRQYLFDFNTGTVMEYTVSSLEVILMNNVELYDEFVALNRRKKRQLMFLYLRKYNEKEPLYFPVN